MASGGGGGGLSLAHEVLAMVSGFTGGAAPSDRAELEFTFTNSLSHCREDGWELGVSRYSTPLVYLLRKSWHPPFSILSDSSSSSSSSSAGGGGAPPPPCAFPPRIDFLEVQRRATPPSDEDFVLDPFIPLPQYRPGDEVQYVKTLGSYALSPSASEVALGAALGAVHTLVHREGSRYIAVLVESRILGLPVGRACFGVAEDGSEYPPPFSEGFQDLDLFKEEGQEEEEEEESAAGQRERELQRGAWALKNKVIKEYTREALAKIQHLGDTWVKASMTLGQLGPLPGATPPRKGIRLKPQAPKAALAKKARLATE